MVELKPCEFRQERALDEGQREIVCTAAGGDWRWWTATPALRLRRYSPAGSRHGTEANREASRRHAASVGRRPDASLLPELLGRE